MKPVLALAGITAATLLLTGCHSSADPTTAPGFTVSAQPAPSPTVIAAKVGTPFDYVQSFTDTADVVNWQVTVTALTCGIDVLHNAADNPAYTSGKWTTPPPQRIDAHAPAGKTFCRLDATMRNTGSKPAGDYEKFGDIETSAGRYQATGEEEMYVDTNLLTEAKAPDGPFNPGDTATVIKVWTVPAGATPVAVWLPDSPISAAPRVRVAVQ